MGISYLYIGKQDAERIDRGCDLGDSVRVDAYQFPHVSQIENLLCFRSEVEFQKVKEENKKLRDALRTIPDFFFACSDSDEIIPQVVAREALGEVGE